MRFLRPRHLGLTLLALGLLAAWVLAPDLARVEARVETWLEEAGRAGPPHGWQLVRTCAIVAACTFVSEDLTCLAAGALVARGVLGLVSAASACFVGIFVGDVLLFLCGRWFGRPLLARAPARWFLDAARVERAARWLEKRGGIVILSSRFLPGARLPTYFASGALGTSLVRFALWFALAGLLWTPALVAFAAGIGRGLGPGELGSPAASLALLAATIVSAWILLVFARSLSTWRGRALWRVRLRRCARFEYWPIGLFYLPVFALLVGRALRGRRALAFTAANPALPHSGFVGESKKEIHPLLERAGALLPRTLFLGPELAPGERVETVTRFRETHGLPFPLVVKPDAGQRGEGVRIVRDRVSLEDALRSREALIVQEFVPGKEYGLLWARRPGQPGELRSLGRKVLPEVQGDGRRTLERLILEHPEHLPMATALLGQNARRLQVVPAPGERVVVGELGTHCRGARFLDGRSLASPALEAELERLTADMPGFCLGRFDVRTGSDEELARGRFTILELNGVTSEPAHVYDPAIGLPTAWRTMVAQWRLACEIGEENHRRGARISTVAELWGALRAHRALLARRERPAAPRTPEPAGGPAPAQDVHGGPGPEMRGESR